MGSIKKASEIAALLNLLPHPDGGFYLETHRDSSITLPRSLLPSRYKVDRPISTAIYFLLPAGSVAWLHRIPCAETFHFYLGEPLTILELREDGVTKMTVLGLDLEVGERPQYTVHPNVWFGTYPTKDISVSPDGNSFVKAPRRDAENHYSLVGVTCAPAFQFEDSESANCLELVTRFPEMEFLISYLTSSN
ncbi:uncharacterized protein LOC122653516 [Telopea speciosissima]|uniref:uncharacterized protein LOC122653516 n=1 Tax=Telopea speciosissima TaxID=54955 RepID=UPI001CC62B76|nr:uncharacterized protein LOC122653516 [Telopea speciosissima]XP_043703303.1 uncharacterized protein LOC122653516 [Telopea speciosissima]